MTKDFIIKFTPFFTDIMYFNWCLSICRSSRSDVMHQVRTTALDVEMPLITDELANIDEVLQKAEKTLDWNSDGMTMGLQRKIDVSITLY